MNKKHWRNVTFEGFYDPHRDGGGLMSVLELLYVVSAATVTMKDSKSGLNLFWKREGSDENC